MRDGLGMPSDMRRAVRRKISFSAKWTFMKSEFFENKTRHFWTVEIKKQLQTVMFKLDKMTTEREGCSVLMIKYGVVENWVGRWQAASMQRLVNGVKSAVVAIIIDGNFQCENKNSPRNNQSLRNYAWPGYKTSTLLFARIANDVFCNHSTHIRAIKANYLHSEWCIWPKAELGSHFSRWFSDTSLEYQK